MRVDFYHLTRDAAPQAVADIARKALAHDKRMLVVSDSAAQRAAISEALWQAPGFLAHGERGAEAGGKTDARQPILLSDRTEAANQAPIIAFADGLWREAEGFERALLFFDESGRQAARECWKALKSGAGGELHYWKQDTGGWREQG